MKLKKGKYYLIMHPDTAKECTLTIMTNKFMQEGEIMTMREDVFKDVKPTFPSLPLMPQGLVLEKGSIIKAEPV